MPDEEARSKVATEAADRATAIKDLRAVAEQQNENIAELTKSISDLANAVAARPTRRETFNLAAVIATITLAVVGVMFLLVLQNQNTIESCTNPKGECAKRGQEATADAIRSINLTSIFVAQCAIDGAADIRPCVEEKLAQEAARSE